MEYVFFHLLPSIVVGILFLIGFVGSFLPIVPATMIVWLGIFIHKMWVGDPALSWNIFAVLTVLAVLTQVIDYACTYWGARKFGGSWRAGLGAILGLLIGPFIFTPFVGILIGPILGAILAELIGGKRLRHASKAGLGTVVGGFIAFAVKLAILCFMIGCFYYYTV